MQSPRPMNLTISHIKWAKLGADFNKRGIHVNLKNLRANQETDVRQPECDV